MRIHDVQLLRIHEKHPSLKGLLLRDPVTECLRYVGPKHGRLKGNPPVYIKRNNNDRIILLRAHVWMMFRGKVPKGKRVLMKCLNSDCHNPEHMELGEKLISYRRGQHTKYVKLSPEDIWAIRYFSGRTSTMTLERIFGISSERILKIQRGERNVAVATPKGYKPIKAFIKKVEKEGLRCHLNLALDKRYWGQIQRDVEASKLDGREKDILLKFIKGDRIVLLEKEYNIPRANVYLLRQRALLRIWRTLGSREWIRLASKGKIEKWDREWPKLGKTRK